MNSLVDQLRADVDRATADSRPVDHAAIQGRARRQRRARGAVVAVGATAAVAAGGVVVVGLQPPPTTSVEVLGTPHEAEQTGGGDQDASVTESYEDWHQRKEAAVREVVEQAPQPQRDALADGIVSADELDDARRAFADCMRDAGHDVTLNDDGSHDITSSPDDDDTRCWDAHLSAVAPARHWQQMDHRAEWRAWQDRLAERPDDLGLEEEAQSVGSLQARILADGIVERGEVDAAVDRAVECGEAHGLTVEVAEHPTGFSFSAVSVSGGDARALEDCLAEHVDRVNAAWMRQQADAAPDGPDELRACLQDAGVDPDMALEAWRGSLPAEMANAISACETLHGGTG